jgi:membrane-associated phospholipid phosphatase
MPLTSFNPRLASRLKYTIPFLSVIALALACRDSNPHDGHVVALLFSGAIYRFYIAVTVGLLLLVAWRRRSNQLIRWLLTLSICNLLIVQSLHLLIPLPRPLYHPAHIHPAHFSPGFPSAHTSYVFGLAWLILQVDYRLAPLWFGMAVAVGWSRVEIGSHYPYQVLAGAALGCGLGWWMSRLAPMALRARPFKRCKGSAPGVPPTAFAGELKNPRRVRETDASEFAAIEGEDRLLHQAVGKKEVPEKSF